MNHKRKSHNGNHCGSNGIRSTVTTIIAVEPASAQVSQDQVGKYFN